MAPVFTTICCFLYIAMSWQFTEATLAEFVEKPTSVNITQGSIAEFNCTGYSQGFHWVINNRLPDHHDNSQRGLEEINEVVNSTTNLNIHILRVPAEPKNNGVNIKCVIYNSQFVQSDLVYLYIQGSLSEITDVHLTQVNSTTVQLSYSSPPTLMGVPILNYSIELFSSSNNLTSEIYWTSEETILVTLNNPCINYSLQISAWNNVGKGNITILPLILYQVPTTPPLNTTLKFVSDNNYIDVSAESIINTDCVGRVPDNVTILLFPVYTVTCQLPINGSDCNEVTISILNEKRWLIHVNISDHIVPQRHYQIHLMFGNKAGITPMSTAMISTFQTQRAIIEYSNDYVCINCYFAEGSTSSGCHGIFVDIHEVLHNQTFTVPRSDTPPNFGRNCEVMLSGEYCVLIFDINKSGHIESEIALKLSAIVRQQVETTTIKTSSFIDTGTSSQLITRIVTTTIEPSGQSSTNNISLLLIILFVTGGVLLLTSIIVISLMGCLIRTKKKNKRLKMSVWTAHERQRHTELFLNTLTDDPPPSLLPRTPPTQQIPDPMYDNMEEIQFRATNIQAVEFQECPAYNKLPLQSTK